LLAILLFSCATSSVKYKERSHPSGLSWNNKYLTQVDEAIALSADNPISALLLFEGVLKESSDSSPGRMYHAWLKEQISSLRPSALEILNRDYASARGAMDLRDMTIIREVGEKVQKGLFDVQEYTVVRDAAFRGTTEPTTWKVAVKKAEVIQEPESDIETLLRIYGAHVGGVGREMVINQLSISKGFGNITTSFKTNGEDLVVSSSPGSNLRTVKIGTRTFNVTALQKTKLLIDTSVENICMESDKPYALWSLSDEARIKASMPSSGATSNRWLFRNMFALVPPGEQPIYSNDWSKSDSALGHSETHSLSFGDSVDAKICFDLPEGVDIAELRFIVYGALPIEVTVEP